MTARAWQGTLPTLLIRLFSGGMLAAALLLSTSCKRGPVDTTKTYYEDDEAPEFQVHILNGVETKVPWAEVPENQRWFEEWGNPRGDRPIERVPIVRVVSVSTDKEGRPVPLDKGYRIQTTTEGLNPRFHMCSFGGSAR
jgi:hypothetical protein